MSVTNFRDNPQKNKNPSLRKFLVNQNYNSQFILENKGQSLKLTQHKNSLKLSNPQSNIIRSIHALAPVLWGNAPLYLTLCQTYKSHSKNPRYFYESKKSARSANPLKSFCFVLLPQKVESPYPLDSNLQSKVALIGSYIIYFIHRLKSFALDCLSLPKASLAKTIRLRFVQFTRFATFHTIFKGNQIQT